MTMASFSCEMRCLPHCFSGALTARAMATEATQPCPRAVLYILPPFNSGSVASMKACFIAIPLRAMALALIAEAQSVALWVRGFLSQSPQNESPSRLALRILAEAEMRKRLRKLKMSCEYLCPFHLLLTRPTLRPVRRRICSTRLKS